MKSVSEMTDTELNALIAEAMGRSIPGDIFWMNDNGYPMCSIRKWNPSTEIAQAYKCLEWAEGKGWYLSEQTNSQTWVSLTLLKYGDADCIADYDILSADVSRANRTLEQATARCIAECIGQIVMEERG